MQMLSSKISRSDIHSVECLFYNGMCYVNLHFTYLITAVDNMDLFCCSYMKAIGDVDVEMLVTTSKLDVSQFSFKFCLTYMYVHVGS